MRRNLAELLLLGPEQCKQPVFIPLGIRKKKLTTYVKSSRVVVDAACLGVMDLVEELLEGKDRILITTNWMKVINSGVDRSIKNARKIRSSQANN